MTKSYEDPNRAPKADHVQGFKCDHCEHFHLALMDGKDRFIATAILSQDQIEGMLDIIQENLDLTIQ